MGWMARLVWRLYGLGGIKLKVMGIVLALALVLGGTVIIQARYALEQQGRDQLSRQAESLARNIASRSIDLVLTHNLYALRELLQDTAESYPDLRYAIIYDAAGNVVDSTFGRQMPVSLLTARTLSTEDESEPVMLTTGQEQIYDVQVPMFSGRAGAARVGITDRRLTGGMWTTVRRMLTQTGLITAGALAAAYLLTLLLTRPLEELVSATRAVSAGDLARRARRYSDDEIGQLALDFNQMVDAVQSSRLELLRHNRALSVLHRVAETATQPPDRGGVALRITETVKSSLGLSQACIFRFSGTSESLEYTSTNEQSGCVHADAVRALAFQEGRPAVDGNRCVVPLVAEGMVTGALCFHCNPGEEPDGEEAELLMALGRQIGMALEGVRLWEQLKAKEAHRADLLNKLISAQEEERKRIALELHDQTGQLLTSLMVGLKLLEGAQSLEQMRERIVDLRGLAATVLEEVHSLALELRPRVLDDLGLVQALDRYTRDFTRKHGIVVDMEARGFRGHRLPAYAGTTLYRVIQEALTNVARHSGARRVSLSLTWRGDQVKWIIHDDGCGFDMREVMSRPAERLGLFSMRERVDMVGGRFEIRSAPGSGTTIYAQIPAENVVVPEGSETDAEEATAGSGR